MRNIWTLARKELNSYFRSPIAYIVLAAFAGAYGYFFYFEGLARFLLMSITQMQYAQMYGQMVPPMNINEMIVRPLMYLTGVISLFLLPMVTMRLLAEEKKVGTIELLMTSPLTDVQIVMGKFLAAMILYGALLGLTFLYTLILFIFGNPDWKPIASGYLGLLLLGSCFISLGLLLSTFTRNQFVAGSLTFLLLLILWVIQGPTEYSSGVAAQVANYLSLTAHLDNFSKGVINLKDAVYYVSVAALGLFLSVRSVESVRWRA